MSIALSGAIALGIGKTEASTIFQDNFNADTTLEQEGWVIQNNVIKDSNVFYGDSGKSMRYNGPAAYHPNGGVATTFFPTYNCVFEYFVQEKSQPSENNGLTQIRLLCDNGTQWNVTDWGIEFGLGHINLHNGNSTMSTGLQYNKDSWYYVKRTLNLVDNTGEFYMREVNNPVNKITISNLGEAHNSNKIVGLVMYLDDISSYVDEVKVSTIESSGLQPFWPQPPSNPEKSIPEFPSLELLILSSLGLFRRR